LLSTAPGLIIAFTFSNFLKAEPPIEFQRGIVVLGDFNRRIDLFGARDHLWQEIDDGVPAGLDLFRFPFREESKCWAGTRRHYPEPIDFIVLDARAHQLLVPDSFREFDYPPGQRDLKRGTPSDHCPIALRLEF